jgi:hypothetical protein
LVWCKDEWLLLFSGKIWIVFTSVWFGVWMSGGSCSAERFGLYLRVFGLVYG